MASADITAAANANETAFNRLVWFNTVILATVFGAACGGLLLVATYASLAVSSAMGVEPGQYLMLLGVFLPGYTVTPVGAWIGFFWGFVYAALSGGVMYQIYARSAGRDWAKTVTFDVKAPRSIMQLTLILSPRALGLAVGAILALQVFLSTAWLVARGTADESVHAELLNQYLPGYTVSMPGALIGAVWLFVYGFAFSCLFAVVYNYVAKKRLGGGSSNGR
ncbi:MAG: hypothetical protein GC189_03555 [Alphaproteobacteria bacterium]|nr:hypothetical protein [Alphaproteobacteria bacterium]